MGDKEEGACNPSENIGFTGPMTEERTDDISSAYHRIAISLHPAFFPLDQLLLRWRRTTNSLGGGCFLSVGSIWRVLTTVGGPRGELNLSNNSARPVDLTGDFISSFRESAIKRRTPEVHQGPDTGHPEWDHIHSAIAMRQKSLEGSNGPIVLAEESLQSNDEVTDRIPGHTATVNGIVELTGLEVIEEVLEATNRLKHWSSGGSIVDDLLEIEKVPCRPPNVFLAVVEGEAKPICSEMKR